MTNRGSKARRRQERREAARLRARRRRLVVLIAVAGAIAVAVAFVLLRPPPPELVGVETFPAQGRGHLGDGEAAPTYNSDPPTSGDHSPSAAQCGIYTREIPDVLQVHNLEHGTVVVQYAPDLPIDQVEALQSFARTKQSHIILAPRSGMDSPLVLTSWTRMLRLQDVDLDTVDVYYDEFVFSGPEVGVPCPFEVDESS